MAVISSGGEILVLKNTHFYYKFLSQNSIIYFAAHGVECNCINEVWVEPFLYKVNFKCEQVNGVFLKSIYWAYVEKYKTESKTAIWINYL